MRARIRLTLGPILYYWPRARVFAFYEEMAHARPDVIYLGETVCSRRRELRADDWLDLARELAANGSQVVLSSQVLLESEPDVKAMRRLAENGEFLVEANDMGAVRVLQARTAFVAGASLNVFNAQSLQLLGELGAVRWVVAPEISAAELAPIQAARAPGMQTEVLAYGRVPLAYSARCFTARHFRLQKDLCEFRCLQQEQGLRLRTREAEPFLVLNGIQTLSDHVHNLVGALPQLRDLGVDLLRISPQAQHTARILQLFRAALEGAAGGADSSAIREEVRALMPAQACNGFWHGLAGMDEAAA